MNIDGHCLSVKDFQRNQDTEKLYENLYGTEEQLQLQTSKLNSLMVNMKSKPAEVNSKFGTGRLVMDKAEAASLYTPIMRLACDRSQELQR